MTDNYKFAFLDADNKVINVAVFDSENPEIELLEAIKEQLKATDYKSCLLYGEAYIDGHFIDNYFVPMKPYESWILDAETHEWKAPIPMPIGEGLYYWNEETLSWIKVEVPQE